eukprot:gnl/TRDRNA2_/TRDRNA2_47825_c0_seq1.p1 gnl/TRDRNA2_/TRDRNA2_47825_c0~~gnl/TRDRNA2_/TRDRNA2_47825_c0_seq1.p1  ORF type:complete len:173 (-),score=21.97 gnl/TRDRNA2_/TRDRNA2_47825_c0_seq1:14-532(-)
MTFLHSTAVIRTILRARQKGARNRKEASCENAAILDVAQAVATIRASGEPRKTGWLWQLDSCIFHRGDMTLRWVVLDPAAATLSIWDRPPREDQGSTTPRAPGPRPKAPRKVLSLESLELAETNEAGRHVFLRFKDGEFLRLTAETAEEFDGWAEALTDFRPFSAFETVRSV